MKTLLWLDDLRNPYKSDWLLLFAPTFEGDIIWVKNFEDFVSYIKENGLPDLIGFDHDLGEDIAIELVSNGTNKKVARKIKKESKSGYDAAKWLVDYLLDNNLPMTKWVIQSANPTGKENINGLLINYMKHYNKIN